MKLVFSESQPDYAHYIFPYAVWAFPEPGETPAQLFACGFLPSSRDLDRFYLCRQVRVQLKGYEPSSENRRILRKGEGIRAQLISRAEFDYTPARRAFYRNYAEARFGPNMMSDERLDSLFASRVVSHVLLFTDQATGTEVGTATLYLERPALAYYYYAFYDLQHPCRNLGMFMMTTAVGWFAEQGFQQVYLGSCYSRNALYKTQFAGAEFFNGVRWSTDVEELKYLVRREQRDRHLLEEEEYRRLFYEGDLAQVAALTPFQVACRPL